MKNLLKKSRQLVVIGAGGHASNIVNVAASLNYSIFGFIDSDKASQTLFGRPILSDLKDIVALENYDFCLALGDNYQREKYFLKILKMYPNIMFPTLIHSTASIGPYTKIGAGTVIMPNTTISTNVSIGSFCLLSNQSCVGHNSILYDFSSLGPAATLSGNVSVGLRSAIALGAKVREKVRVGNDVVLGPNSFLNHNLPNNVLAFGSPAVIKKARKSNDCYLR